MPTNTALAFQDLGRLMSLMTGDEKHSTSATSTLDVIWVLYDRIMNIHPDQPSDPDRDRFLLSKGHGPMAYYAVLAAKGFLDEAQLPGFATYDSALGHHPDRTLIAGVEISSGSLGHGLPMAIGAALALRAQGRGEPRIFCLIGDAELDEGSNHEAIALAGRMELGAVTVMAIDNQSSTWGWPGGIAGRFAGEGWCTSEVDGRDHDQLAAALERGGTAPHAVVARVEGKRS